MYVACVGVPWKQDGKDKKPHRRGKVDLRFVLLVRDDGGEHGQNAVQEDLWMARLERPTMKSVSKQSMERKTQTLPMDTQACGLLQPMRFDEK
jgi:hypothetical protein